MSAAESPAYGAHSLILAVEKRCPGERVIAGPFMVEHPMELARAEERAMAVKALRTQIQPDRPARMVVYRQQAYVLRPIEGWVKEGKMVGTVVMGAKKKGGKA